MRRLLQAVLRFSERVWLEDVARARADGDRAWERVSRARIVWSYQIRVYLQEGTWTEVRRAFREGLHPERVRLPGLE